MSKQSNESNSADSLQSKNCPGNILVEAIQQIYDTYLKHISKSLLEVAIKMNHINILIVLDTNLLRSIQDFNDLVPYKCEKTEYYRSPDGKNIYTFIYQNTDIDQSKLILIKSLRGKMHIRQSYSIILDTQLI